MLDFLNTMEEKELYTLLYNNKWRILDNSGNTLSYESNHKLDHLNNIREIIGTICIVSF